MTLEEASNLENKNFEFEQQLNEKIKNLQSEIKESKLVEDVVPIETIPDEKEGIEVQKQSPITILLEDDKMSI